MDILGPNWWELNGKKRKLPKKYRKGLKYRKEGGLDMRFSLNKDYKKEIIDSKRWRFRCPFKEMWEDYIFKKQLS